jgi:MYXO-CTERM domain-containing protein
LAPPQYKGNIEMRKTTIASALVLAGVLAQPTLVSAQVDSPTTETRADRDDGDGWGWLGLLGLAGLLGLKRRERTDVRVNPRAA